MYVYVCVCVCVFDKRKNNVDNYYGYAIHL